MTKQRNTKTYSDINLDFLSHPRTRDIVKKTDEDAVKASVVNLVRTKPYERPFHPEIGSQVYALLFENFTPITGQIIERTIRDVINKFEPRVEIINVAVTEAQDYNSISVTITFKLRNSERPITVTTLLERVR